jgi:hypothetical protein
MLPSIIEVPHIVISSSYHKVRQQSCTFSSYQLSATSSQVDTFSQCQLKIWAINTFIHSNIIIKMNMTVNPHSNQYHQLDDEHKALILGRTLILGQYFKVYFPDGWRISLNAAERGSPTA